MKMLSGINIPFFKKSKKDENGDLEQSYVKKDESAKGRFLDIKKRFSPQAEASGAGITYSALINRDTKLIRINTVSIAVIGLLVAKILFFTDPVTIVTPPNMNEEITVVGNKASESYKTQWALFFSTLLGNIPDKTESSKWTYEWVLGMKNGRPRIAYVNQYSGTPNIKKITINGKEQLATLDNPPPSTGNK